MLEKFKELNISDNIINALNEMGFEEPTPIQAEAIPVAMDGRDMIGQAQTGTGKTAAYGIPVLEKILKAEPTKDIQTVVLSPTRELAMQVAEELNHLAQFTSIQALPIYGGQDMGRQLRRLRKCPQIVVATPGRLIDHMKRGTINLSHISTIVLDEGDEMLDMGFIDDINLIMSATPDTRQTLLFSATMPAAIQKLAETFLHDPEIIRMKSKEVTIDLIEQSYIEVPDRQKFDVLCRLLDLQEPDLAIIFVRTKRRVDEVAEALKKRGYSAEGIHGDLTQAKRDSVIRQFREKTIDILVATDVAARGLDISGVTHVFNYDLPQDPESYVHRVGRTGRAGQSGEATTFVIPREIEHLRTIERLIKRRITRSKAPSFSEVLEGAQQAAIRNLVHATEEGDFSTYKANAEELLTHFDSVALISAAIKLLTKEPDTTPVKITEEAPLHVRRNKSNNGGGRRRYDHNRDHGRSASNRRNDKGGDHSRSHSRRDDHGNDHKERNDRNGENNRHETRRHYSPGNRGNYKGSAPRREKKEFKEPNHSVFKPYFKD
jgi:ATP-dependent RNA helicase DeaD